MKNFVLGHCLICFSRQNQFLSPLRKYKEKSTVWRDPQFLSYTSNQCPKFFFLFFGHEITITISRGLVRCTPQSPVLYFPKGINQRRWSQKKGIDDKFSNYASLKLAKAESMMNSFILPPLALLSGLLEFSFGAKGIYRGQLKLITRQCIGHRELTYNFHLRNHPSFNRSLWHCHHKILPSNINYLIY